MSASSKFAFSEYTLKARVFPAILISLPIVSVCDAAFGIFALGIGTSIEKNALFGKGAFLTALVFALSHLNRFIGAEIFERFWSKDETTFATTEMLLPENTNISEDTRVAVLKKIKEDFSVVLPKQPISTSDEPVLRRRIVDVVSRIRERTRGHALLLQHNIEYGFVRNLIGGSLVLFVFSLGFLGLEKAGYIPPIPSWTISLNIALLIFSGVLIAISGWLLKRYGLRYAILLFLAYLDTPPLSRGKGVG